MTTPITSMMFDRAWRRNEWDRNKAEVAVETIANLDMAAAEEAFNAEPGEFADKLIAAVRAAAQSGIEYETEKHVRIPDNPESLTVPVLDALVRPFSNGFLRSHPSKTELLDELAAIASRQCRHAEWAPFELVDPLPPPSRPSGHYILNREERTNKTAYEQLREEYIKGL